MKIDTNHEIVGRKNSELGDWSESSLYPVLSEDRETVIGVFSAEHGTPEGYILSEKRQAYVPARYSATLQFSRPPQSLAKDCEDWEGRSLYESEEQARASLIEHLGDKGYSDPKAVVGEYVIIELAKEQ